MCILQTKGSLEEKNAIIILREEREAPNYLQLLHMKIAGAKGLPF